MKNSSKITKKLCVECGKTKPIEEFERRWNNHSRICKSCISKRKLKKKYDTALEEYLNTDAMHIQRKYKDIDAYRILRKKDSKIDFIDKREKFVRLNYYLNAWISSYGRVIVCEDGQYRLKRGGTFRPGTYLQ